MMGRRDEMNQSGCDKWRLEAEPVMGGRERWTKGMSSLWLKKRRKLPPADNDGYGFLLRFSGVNQLKLVPIVSFRNLADIFDRIV
jgi:hypothetical protein